MKKIIVLLTLYAIAVIYQEGFANPKVTKIVNATDIKESEEAQLYNPCGLKSVECEDKDDWIETEVSAYTSRIQEADLSPCTPAKPMDICKEYKETKRCMVANNKYPLGTMIEIEGIGECEIVDRMNRRYKNNIDIYMGKDLKKALEFGRKTLKFKLI